MLVCYIWGVAELYRLAASQLGYVADPLSWEVSLLLKMILSCPLVLGRGGWGVMVGEFTAAD